MMRRSLPLALAAVLALPGAALAAKPAISPTASDVSAARTTSVEIANPNGYVLRGKATLLVGGKAVATKRVTLGKRSVKTVRFRLKPRAFGALRAAGAQAATVKLRARRPGGAFKTAKRRLTLRVAGGPAANPGPKPAPAPKPASNRWVGRLGTEGAYDDLAFTLDGTQLRMTKTPLLAVSCAENGTGHYGIWTSYEPFTAPGPWTLGTDGKVDQKGHAVNKLISRGERTITYKVTETARTGDRVTGKLGMSFFESKLDFAYYPAKLWFVNCFGTQSFEAIPAP